MFDVVEAQRNLESRWILNGFTKLDEPEDTDEYLYIALSPTLEDYEDDFDFLFWEPAILALERGVVEDGSKFYRVDVYYEKDAKGKNVLCIVSTCGLCPKKDK